MVDSRKVLEFEIPKGVLVNALTHVSCVAPKAAIALISIDGRFKGININNNANGLEEGHQFDTYASFAIFESESDMLNPRYYVDEQHPWPVVYIACTPGFIAAISELQPKHEDRLEVAVWNVIDENKIKSEVVIYGMHNSNIGSIIEHSHLVVEAGKIVPASTNSLDMDSQRHYV